MERFKEILKTIITFVFILSAISQLQFIVVSEVLIKLLKVWVYKETSIIFYRMCYLIAFAYLIIFILTYLSHKFLFKNRRMYIMATIAIVLLFLHDMFGPFGCLRVKFLTEPY